MSTLIPSLLVFFLITLSWRAYDTIEGIEVAWNVIKLSRVPPNERKRIKTEVKLLKDLEHPNVIKYHNSWVNREREEIVFVTEIMSSGSLKEYFFIDYFHLMTLVISKRIQ